MTVAANMLSIQWDQRASTKPMIFSSYQEVADFFGVDSGEANQALAFFKNGGGEDIIVRLGLGQRDHLLGDNLAGDTLAQLQAIQGTVGITFDGFDYSGVFSGASITSGGLTGEAATFNEVKDAGHLLQAALNANRQTAAITADDTIVPKEAEFWGYVSGAQLYVTSVASGTMEPGGYVTGEGIKSGTSNQLIANRGHDKTNPNAEHWSFFSGTGTTRTVGSAAHPELMQEAYGVLTVGGVSSGTVALGDQMTSSGGTLAPDTYLDYDLGGGQYVVNNAQTWSEPKSRFEAPALTISTDGNGLPIYGVGGALQAYLSVTSNPAAGFDQDPASMGYLTGTAASGLLLSEGEAVSDASPGGQHPTIAAWLNGVVSQLAAGGTSFSVIATAEARIDTSLETWIAKHPGYTLEG